MLDLLKWRETTSYSLHSEVGKENVHKFMCNLVIVVVVDERPDTESRSSWLDAGIKEYLTCHESFAQAIP